MYEWHDFVGNLGVAGVLVTYLLVQLDRMSATSLAYPVINGISALLILVSLLIDFNLSSFIIEICWFLISLVGIYRVLRTAPQ